MTLTEFCVEILPWILSTITIVVMWLVGKYNKIGWAIGFFAQFGWLAYVSCAGAWGFLPLTATMFFVNGKNYLEWRKNEKTTPVVSTQGAGGNSPLAFNKGD